MLLRERAALSRRLRCMRSATVYQDYKTFGQIHAEFATDLSTRQITLRQFYWSHLINKRIPQIVRTRICY